MPWNSACTCAFQSTLSVRRATQAVTHQDTILIISIHALREESDKKKIP